MTKAELERENRKLTELVRPSVVIGNNSFEGSPSSSACEAIGKIADALKEAAVALQNQSPMLHIGDKHYHGADADSDHE